MPSVPRRLDTAGDLLAAALRYASAGWPVFPCKPGAKVPVIASAHGRGDTARLTCRGECGRQGHGYLDATTDPAVIRAWWSRWPRANVAIATGYPAPDVLDVDRRPGGTGSVALNKLIRAGITTGAAALVRTRSGGVHVYFTGTDQDCRSLTQHHIDFRSRGGYVIAPPSWVDADDKGPAGHYELLDHRPGTARLEWQRVVALLDPPRPARRNRPGVRLSTDELPPGVRRALETPVTDRSAALHRLVGACVRAGLDDDAIHDLAAHYEPAVAKYGPRLHAEIDRSLTRIGHR